MKIGDVKAAYHIAAARFFNGLVKMCLFVHKLLLHRFLESCQKRTNFHIEAAHELIHGEREAAVRRLYP